MPEPTALSNPSTPEPQGRKIDALRSSVRPIVTYAAAAVLFGSFGYLVWRFADASVAAKVVDSVILLASNILVWWFATRQKPV